MATYWSDMCDSKTCLYRLFDEFGRLLYVGISRNPTGRMEKHKRTDWWADVVEVSHEWFPNRTAALGAERSAIHHEDPIYNRVRPRLECC